MAHDQPDLPELLNTVHEFIANITSKLEGQDRYFALCASFLLEISLRELEQWRPLESEDDRQLRALAKVKEDMPIGEVVKTLSSAIRDGEFDQRLEQLLPKLIRHVEHKVKVTKPSQLHG